MPAVAKPNKPVKFTRNPSANYGVQVEPIPGINLSASQLTVSHACDRRYHQFNYQTTAVNYTGGVQTGNGAITKVTGAGTGGTATITVNGFQVPTSAAIVTGGSGYVTGDIVSVADLTGAGQTWTVTATSGAITALTLVANSATATAIDPRLVINVIQITVGTTIVLQTTAQMEIFRALFNAASMSYGQLPIYFTEPWRNLTDGRSTSWDMAGQSIFNTKFILNQGYTNVGITGILVYDYIRNTVAGEIDQVTYQGYVASGNYPLPSLKIIKRQLLTPQLNSGSTIIQPALIPTGWPILRMHFFPANAGTIYQIQMKADTQLVLQGNVGASNNGSIPDQLFELLTERKFVTTLTGNDYSYVSDYDQRTQNKLKVTNLNLQLWTTGSAQGLTILLESLETGYN